MSPARSRWKLRALVLLAGCAACRAPERERAPSSVHGSESATTAVAQREHAPSPVDASERAPSTASEPATESAPDLAASSQAQESTPAIDGAQTSGATHQAASDSRAPAHSDSWIHGSVATRYRYRTEDGDDDQDLDTVVSLELGDPRKDRVSGHVLARAGADLDGATASDPFFSLDDTFQESLTARLYAAYADLRPQSAEPGQVERWRIGRQIDYTTPEFAWFDGASLQTRELPRSHLQGGAYGGLPVHLFESSASGDALFGLFAQGRPWRDGRVRADWMHLEDETRLAKHENDLFALDVGQQLGAPLRVEGRYTHLESQPRDARVQASWYDARRELTLFVSYFELLHTQKGLALELDPFFTTLAEQFPYRQGRLLATKSFGESLLLQGGADVRRVSDASDVGQFNRDFERGFLTATFADLLPLRLALSLTGEVWNSKDSDIATWGADVSRSFDKRLDASVGSSYALFKYDLFSIEERNDVRTYYVALRWKRKDGSAFDLRYEFEDSAFGDFQTLRLGAAWRF